MWRGLYTAATGMISEQKRTDVIANNIANAATTGYKRDVAIHKEFHNMLIQRVNDFDTAGSVGMDVAPFNSLADLGTSKEDVTQIKGFTADPFNRPNIGQLGLGDYIDEIAVDYQQGALETTSNAFDLAIVGDGFEPFSKTTRATCRTFAATIFWTCRATRFAFPPTSAIRKSQSRATAR